MQRMSSICLSQFNVLFWFYFIAHFVYLYLCIFRVRIKIIIIWPSSSVQLEYLSIAIALGELGLQIARDTNMNTNVHGVS